MWRAWLLALSLVLLASPSAFSQAGEAALSSLLDSLENESTALLLELASLKIKSQSQIEKLNDSEALIASLWLRLIDSQKTIDGFNQTLKDSAQSIESLASSLMKSQAELAALRTELNELRNSLKQSESSLIIKSILLGAGCFVAGAGSGLLLYHLVFNVNR